MQRQMKGRPSKPPFITEADLEAIWDTGNPAYFTAMSKELGFSHNEEEYTRNHLLKIISCLIYIGFDRWKGFDNDFRRLFLDPDHEAREDMDLPFDEMSLQDMGFWKGHAHAFFEAQFQFIPIEIPELGRTDEPRLFPEFSIVPITETEEIIHPTSGEDPLVLVTRARIAPGYLKGYGNAVTGDSYPTVAIKTFKPEVAPAFKKERNNLIWLKQFEAPHKSITLCYTAFGIGERGSMWGYIVSPIADCNLIDVLIGTCIAFDDKVDEFRPRAILRKAADIAGALHWLHDKKWSREHNTFVSGCIHMDMKPPNILVTWSPRTDEFWDWKLTDFGISATGFRTTRDTAAEETTIRTVASERHDHGVGPYEAPEINPAGGNEVGCSSDVWSFGCILLDLLAFSVGGPSNVRNLQRSRQESIPNYFHDGKGNVKPGIIELIESWESSAKWTSLWKTIALKVLRGNPAERPKAQMVETDLKRFIDEFRGETSHLPGSYLDMSPWATPWKASRQWSRPVEPILADDGPLTLQSDPTESYCWEVDRVTDLGIDWTKILVFPDEEWFVFVAENTAYALKSPIWPERSASTSARRQFFADPARKVGNLFSMEESGWKIEGVSAAGAYAGILWSRQSGRLFLQICEKDSQADGQEYNEFPMEPHRNESPRDIYCNLTWSYRAGDYLGRHSVLMKSTMKHGNSRNLLVPLECRRSSTDLTLLFLTLDIYGNGAIIGEKGDNLHRIEFKHFDGMVRGAFSVHGPKVYFVQDDAGKPSKICTLDIKIEAAENWIPEIKDSGIKAGTLEGFDRNGPGTSGFAIRDLEKQVWLYVTVCESEKKWFIRKVLIAK
ncbi:kinase-like protein [Saccharata proteae CBS 121410]|uniref:Kinase-like protein n=1 Tax=Saccharata proteae CBS 121410 TaxID=1314787 RepID=A0A6A5YAY6_9PEZI|nr:kinase-like protein [Saccharata proteae CBS 121410]